MGQPMVNQTPTLLYAHMNKYIHLNAHMHKHIHTHIFIGWDDPQDTRTILQVGWIWTKILPVLALSYFRWSAGILDCWNQCTRILTTSILRNLSRHICCRSWIMIQILWPLSMFTSVKWKKKIFIYIYIKILKINISNRLHGKKADAKLTAYTGEKERGKKSSELQNTWQGSNQLVQWHFSEGFGTAVVDNQHPIH